MTSAGSRKAMADRQIQAVIFNLKEERFLDRSKQTLDLERTHALKLLQLSHKDVKVAQKRLKTKVSRINSHLTPEEIIDFKVQEIQGKIPAERKIITSSAIKISSARRRLKLLPSDNVTGPQRSNLPHDHTIQGPGNSHKSAHGQKTKPLSAPATRTNRDGANTSLPATCKHGHIREPGSKGSRPMTSAGFTTRSIAPHSPATQRPHTAHAVNYSSHDLHDKSEGPEYGNGGVGGRRYSVDSDSSLGSNLAKQRAAERRQEILENEHIKSSEIEKRRVLFMDNALKWAVENPSLDVEPPDVSETIKRIGSANAKRTGSASRTGRIARQRSQHLFRNIANDGQEVEPLSEQEECKNKLLDAWKDLKKCRYLRLTEEGDLSGVSTLAKDQYAMLKTLRPGFRKLAPRRESGAGLLRRQSISVPVIVE